MSEEYSTSDHFALPAVATVDTARYVVLFSGRPAGEYREWLTNGDLHSVYDYNDRGRGPHEEAVVRVGAGGVPTSISIVGHDYLKDGVNENFTTSGSADPRPYKK